MFRPILLLQFLLLFVIALTYASCTYDHEMNTVCSNIPDNVSFNLDIQPIFTSTCSDLGCHSGGAPEANLNLESTAYEDLTKPGTGYIDTIAPTHSILYSQLSSQTLPMPPDGKLDPCKISLILKWIEQGAKNN